MRPNNQQLSNHLSQLAKTTYDARFASKKQLNSLFAYILDLNGINEGNLGSKMSEYIEARNFDIADKARWDAQEPTAKITSKEIQEKRAEISRIQAAQESFENFTIRPQNLRKWRLDTTIEPNKGSMIVIDSDATREDIIEIHRFLNLVLCHKDWYELATIDPNKINEKNSIYDGKVLGKYDQKDGSEMLSGTTATDTIPIIKMQNGNYRVLTITRQSGEAALNGGMNEGIAINKLATAVTEFIEEQISGSLFNPEYANNDIANDKFNKLSNEERKGLINNLKLDASVLKHADLISNILAKDGDFSAKFNELLQHRKEFKLSDFDFDHLVVSLKTQLYKELCKEQRAGIKADLLELIKNSKITFKSLKMHSDPRSTNAASITTDPFAFVLDEHKLTAMLAKAGVGIKAGDDAKDAKIVKLSDMVQGFIFADHPTIVMEALAQAIQKGEIEVNDDLLAQIAIMEKSVETRQEYLQTKVYSKINEIHLLMRDKQTTLEDMQAFHQLSQDAQSAILPLQEMHAKLIDMQFKIAKMPLIEKPRDQELSVNTQLRKKAFEEHNVAERIAEIRNQMKENGLDDPHGEYARRLNWLIKAFVYLDVPYDAIDIEIEAFKTSMAIRTQHPQAQQRDTCSRACNLELNVLNIAMLIEGWKNELQQLKSYSGSDKRAKAAQLQAQIREGDNFIAEAKKLIVAYRAQMYKNDGPAKFTKDGVVNYDEHDKVSMNKPHDRAILTAMEDCSKKVASILVKQHFSGNLEEIPEWFKNNDALVIVDPQRGFTEEHLGELGVAGSKDHIASINKMIAWAIALNKPIIISGDHHQYDSLWAKGEKFSKLPDDEKHKHAGSTCWDNHCCCGTPGALAAAGLIIPTGYENLMFVAKGTQPDSHPDSCVHSNKEGSIALEELLQKNVKSATVCGWVTEICVKQTAEHLLAAGVDVTIPHNGTVPLYGKASMEDSYIKEKYTGELAQTQQKMLNNPGNKGSQELLRHLESGRLGRLDVVASNNSQPKTLFEGSSAKRQRLASQ